MTRYEVSISVDDDRDDEQLADALLSVLPDNAALSIKKVDEAEAWSERQADLREAERDAGADWDLR